MRTIRRLSLAIALIAMTLAAAPPANAAPGFATFGTVTCPQPWLISDFGPTNLCTELSLAGADGRAGYYSPITRAFSPSTPWVDVIDSNTHTIAGLVATDGVSGTFRGRGRLRTNFGDVIYGAQYAYFGFQPIGRWGNYSYATGKFHPGGDWLNADGPIR